MKEHVNAQDVRADVLAAVKPFLGRAEYAVTDADIVDPCIENAVSKETNREDVIWSASLSCPTRYAGRNDGIVAADAALALGRLSRDRCVQEAREAEHHA